MSSQSSSEISGCNNKVFGASDDSLVYTDDDNRLKVPWCNKVCDPSDNSSHADSEDEYSQSDKNDNSFLIFGPSEDKNELPPQSKPQNEVFDAASQCVKYAFDKNVDPLPKKSGNKVHGAYDDSASEDKSEINDKAEYSSPKPQSQICDASVAPIKNPVKQESNDDDAKVEFGFCENPIELYESEKTLYYDYFAKDSESPVIPVFDSQLLDNLFDIQIETMRPVQVAAFQALFFPSPNASKPDKQPDFLGISRTGSGKTLAFLVPIIQKCMDRLQSLREKRTRNPMVLIIAHSTTLVKNIYERALELVKDTEVDVQLISGQTNFIRDAHFDIGVCTIGRFLNHFGSDKRSGRDVILNINDVEFLVIDEADKMAADDEFLRLYETMKQKADFTTLAFSATNSYEVSKFLDADNYYQFLYGALNTVSTAVKQIMWQVDSRSFSRFVGAAHRKSEVISYEVGENPHPMDVLIIFLKTRPKKRFMIFAKRNLVAEFIARKLTMHGLDAVAVHGDQSAESKKKFLKFFVDGKVRILVATNLLTRGTDIPVDFVVNYDLPLSYTEYVHRCGRTGRNKEQGHAITFIDLKNPDDYPLQVLQEIILHLPDDFKMPAFLAESAEMLRNTKKSKRICSRKYFILIMLFINVLFKYI